jgi:hypothetical protein
VLPEITLTKVAVSANGSKRTITAALTEDDGPAIIGRTITFFADGVQIGQAKTDKSGVATFRPPAKFNGGKHTYQATFGGDAGYAGSSGEASTT